MQRWTEKGAKMKLQTGGDSMNKANISYQYSENSRETVVTVYRNKKPVTKVITDKTTGLTTVEVFKEDVKFPIERYVHNRIH